MLTKNQQKVKDAAAYWDVKKAGERLLWRFSLKSFAPNEDDQMALKSVLAWINRNASENVNNNQLFAKLYVYFLTQEIRYNQATVLDEKLQKKVHSMLDKPLALFYKAFINDLYSSQFNKLKEGQTLQESNEVMMDIIQFKETFNEDYCIGKLNQMISESLNRFS